MNKLAKQLVSLGQTHPELRGHLRPVLAHLDKQAANPMAQLDFDALFGELRSATQKNDGGDVGAIRGIMAYKYKARFTKEVKPYLEGLLLSKIRRYSQGDVLTLTMHGSMGRTTTVKVKVESDYAETSKASGGSNRAVLYVMKPRGRKTGAIFHYPSDSTLYYQATLVTQIEPIVWIS